MAVGLPTRLHRLWSYEHEAEQGGRTADAVPHCSESGYIYLSTTNNESAPLLEQQMAAYWRSFAKYGNPNTAKHRGAPEWPAYTNATDTNLAFDPIHRAADAIHLALDASQFELHLSEEPIQL